MDYKQILSNLSDALQEIKDLKQANDGRDIEDKMVAVGDFLYRNIDDVYNSVSDAVAAIDELIDKLESLEAQYEELEEENETLKNSIQEANEY